MNRRGFLGGLAGCFAAAAAPGILAQGVIMPVRRIALPSDTIVFRRWLPYGSEDHFVDALRYGLGVREMEVGRIDNFRFIDDREAPNDLRSIEYMKNAMWRNMMDNMTMAIPAIWRPR
jgi:hypothetical protein